MYLASSAHMYMYIYMYMMCDVYTITHSQSYTHTRSLSRSTSLSLPPTSLYPTPVYYQIDRQLQTYLQRVEAVLGKGWENHVEGQKLKQDGDAFRSKLNTQQLFEDWKKRVESRQQAVQGRIFNIVSSRTRSGTILKLQVNFAPETITLAKEVCDIWTH